MPTARADCAYRLRVPTARADYACRLRVSLETLIADELEHRPAFETFKSNVCHSVKDMGELDFMISTLESGKIRELYDR